MLNFTVVALIYSAYEVLLVLGLNVQYGMTGILNLSFIVPYAAGAYITGIIAGPPAGEGVYYIGGYNLPWYVGLLAGLAAAYVIAALIGSFTLGRRLRGSYLAVGTLVVAVVLAQTVSQQQNLFDGQSGLIGVPSPVGAVASSNASGALFLVIAGVITVICFILCEMLRRAPFGRMLRAIRDDEVASQVFGYNVFWMRMKAFIFGSMLAGLAGSLTILYTGGFAPSGWTVSEIIFALTCLFVGGVGNNWGALVGAVLIELALTQASTLVPTLQSNPAVVQSIRSGLVGLILILILRFRPQGLLPERPILLKPPPGSDYLRRMLQRTLAPRVSDPRSSGRVT